MKYDVAVVGAGVVRALIARELSRTALRVAPSAKFIAPAMRTTNSYSAILPC